MDKQSIVRSAAAFIAGHPGNRLPCALTGQPEDLSIYDAPLFAFGSAQDPMFQAFKAPQAIGAHFMAPAEWLPKARTVVSFFLPFSEAVRKSNRQEFCKPSQEWLFGRIEGQKLVDNLCIFLCEYLEQAGFAALAPSLDGRFRMTTAGNTLHGATYTSNWSERHAGFACGLGTFGLSRGLITKKGMAGRLGSVLTALFLTPDERAYTNLTEYCTLCGACVRHCPAGAISLQTGKDHAICSAFLDETKKKFAPRYGCGKCQVGVPCEAGIPINRGSR